MKLCSGCKETKSLSEFHKNRSQKDGLAIWCKRCNNVSTARRYAKHGAKLNAKAKEWRKNNPERANVASRKYRAANLEKTRIRSKKYRIGNPGKIKKAKAICRARLQNAFVAPVNYQEIFTRDGGRCHICKELVDSKKWHLDHIMPLAKGGTHEPRNVAVSHPRCNQQKSAYGAAQLRLFN